MNETLTFPESCVPFNPSPAYLVGPFDVYDREETLGRELGVYDPNRPDHLHELLERYVFPRWEMIGFTANHRNAIKASIGAALSDPNHDFSRYLQDHDGVCLPATWRIKDSRQFFLNAHAAVCRRWG